MVDEYQKGRLAMFAMHFEKGHNYTLYDRWISQDEPYEVQHETVSNAALGCPHSLLAIWQIVHARSHCLQALYTAWKSSRSWQIMHARSHCLKAPFLPGRAAEPGRTLCPFVPGPMSLAGWQASRRPPPHITHPPFACMQCPPCSPLPPGARARVCVGGATQGCEP